MSSSVLSRYAKIAVGAVGLAATLVVTFLTPDTWPYRLVTAVMTVVTLAGQAAVPNARPLPLAAGDLLRAVQVAYAHRAELVAWVRQVTAELVAGNPALPAPPPSAALASRQPFGPDGPLHE